MNDTLIAVLRLIAILSIIAATSRKIWVLQQNTREWNGIGRAIRAEKCVYLLMWVWILVRPLSPALRAEWILVVLAVAITIVETRVTLLLPGSEIRHKETKDARDLRQDTREDGLDQRAVGLDKRGWDMSKESMAQEGMRNDLDDRGHVMDERETEASR